MEKVRGRLLRRRFRRTVSAEALLEGLILQASQHLIRADGVLDRLGVYLHKGT